MACHLFQHTLTRRVVVQFKGLEKGNIKRWEDLKEKFIKIFQSRREYIGYYVNLQFIKQVHDEHLIEFTERFNDEASKILGVRDDQKISAFIDNIIKGKLYIKLTCKTPKTWQELLDRSRAFKKTSKMNTAKIKERNNISILLILGLSLG